MARAELAVPTVHCAACRLNIEEALEDVAGVAVSVVDLDAKVVTVDYDHDTVGLPTILAAIEAAGYPVS